MIDVFIIGRKHRTDAMGKYNPKTKEITLKKGSVVSEDVADFSHKDSILKLRKEIVDKNGKLKVDKAFSNATAAAQFVCGYSVSGPVAWHVEKHKTLSEWLKENE